MHSCTRIEYYKILLPIFSVAAYGGIELGCLNFWNDFLPWKKLPLFIISLLALLFHFFWDTVLARQMALTIPIVGCVLVLMHVMS